MRKNTQLIDGSNLLATIVEKIETSFTEDISLLICYGSYVTGDYGGMSDIDFFFVPRTDRGNQLAHQFILKDIGYDLWPVSWERLQNISTLEAQPASILMDGAVLFASSEQDLQMLEDLQNNLKHNLGEEAVIKQAAARCLERSKALYFHLQDNESPTFFIEAIQIVETLLVAIATLNGAYLQKGLKRIENELGRFSMVLPGFLDQYGKIIRTGTRVEVLQLVHELIVETDRLWKSKFDHEDKKVDPADLAGFYEEFKSTYNKLLLACEEQDYEKAYYAGFMIDRETELFLVKVTGERIFPNILNEVLSNDFEAMRAGCLQHERQLLRLLERHGITINLYQDIHEFRQKFLHRTF